MQTKAKRHDTKRNESGTVIKCTICHCTLLSCELGCGRVDNLFLGIWVFACRPSCHLQSKLLASFEKFAPQVIRVPIAPAQVVREEKLRTS